MSKLSFKNKIDLIFAVILFIIFYLVYITNNRSIVVQNNRALIEESYRTTIVLDRLMSAALDIETGIRGFAITGQESFLKVYDKGCSDIQIWSDSLENLKRHTAQEQILVRNIQELSSQKVEFSRKIKDIQTLEGSKSAQILISSGQGRIIMERLRSKVHQFQSNQSRVLAFNLRKIDENIERRNTNHIVFAAVTIIFLIIGYLAIRRNADRMEGNSLTLQKLADELTVHNGQLKEFAHIASHNLRSSAHNMIALIELIDEDSPKEEYQKIFDMLKRVAQNMELSLNELLEIIRIKKNREIQKENITFQSVYDKVVETLQGDILKHNIQIKCDFSKAPEVFYTKMYLESAIQNLISNAIKYRSPERTPEILVYSEMVGGQVELHIQDNGLGIDMQRHGDKLFGLYQMFHNHPEAKGIGLFLTRAQIENQGGKIRATSDGKSGTTFSIRFAKA